MDAAAWDVAALYSEHRARALAIVRRIVGDADEAEDVVQDVFARLALRPSAGAFGGRASERTWLHRVMVNGAINWLRARRRRGRLELPLPELPSPEAVASGRQLERRFLAALEHVPPAHRQVLWLREMRGLDYPEIGRLLGIPEGTVKSSLHRARTRVAALMAEGAAP